MVHRGAVLKKAIDKSEFSIKRIAEKSGVSRGIINRMISSPTADLDNIIRIGKAINYDFSKEIPEIKSDGPNAVNQENLSYMFKYYEALEKIVMLQEKVAKYEAKKK